MRKNFPVSFIIVGVARWWYFYPFEKLLQQRRHHLAATQAGILIGFSKTRLFTFRLINFAYPSGIEIPFPCHFGHWSEGIEGFRKFQRFFLTLIGITNFGSRSIKVSFDSNGPFLIENF